MSGHCPCVASGLSSHAIARAFGHCDRGGTDYPCDPSDLERCEKYIGATGISDYRLVEVMSPISPQWAALVHHWGELVALLNSERPSGTAPLTYARMKELIYGKATS